MFELQDIRYHTIAYGSRHEVSDAVKYHVSDGRYRIIGPNMRLYCIRIKGVVYPDPESAPLERQMHAKVSAMQYFA